MLRWSPEPVVVVLAAAALVVYGRGRRALAAAGTRPSGRGPALFVAGVAVATLAVVSPLGTYAGALLWVHMVQHLLLVLVAAPALVASRATPVLLAGVPARVAAAAGALARSAPARALTRPLVAWTLFAATGWAVHFSPLFDAAARNPVLHAFEHGLFLGTALLFWRPVLGREPVSYPVQIAYLALAMPQNTFLALAIYSASHPLYEAYASPAWGPGALDDQRLAAGLMWVAGDLTLLVAVLAVAGSWATASMAGTDERRPPPAGGE